MKKNRFSYGARKWTRHRHDAKIREEKLLASMRAHKMQKRLVCKAEILERQHDRTKLWPTPKAPQNR